jgi:hypothetical protein
MMRSILKQNKQDLPDLKEALRMAVKYLRCGKYAPEKEHQPNMDFEADENYIKTSFMSDYHIGFDETNMHWRKLNNLLQGLTDDRILNCVFNIRSMICRPYYGCKATQKNY